MNKLEIEVEKVRIVEVPTSKEETQNVKGVTLIPILLKAIIPKQELAEDEVVLDVPQIDIPIPIEYQGMYAFVDGNITQLQDTLAIFPIERVSSEAMISGEVIVQEYIYVIPKTVENAIEVKIEHNPEKINKFEFTVGDLGAELVYQHTFDNTFLVDFDARPTRYIFGITFNISGYTLDAELQQGDEIKLKVNFADGHSSIVKQDNGRTVQFGGIPLNHTGEIESVQFVLTHNGVDYESNKLYPPTRIEYID